MTPDDFQKLLDADPFEPFTVTLAGGSACDVDRPEWATVSAGGTARITRPDGRWSIIALRHVVSITYPDTPIIR